jgi:hypothetical protein
MSYHLIDFSSKINDYNFDNIIIGRKVKIDEDNAKYYIYYQKEQDLKSPNEIYIRLPTLRLIYGLANHKYNQVNIPIYPNWELTKKFIDFIVQLEEDIQNCFLEKNINKEFISLIKKKNSLNFIRTDLNNKIKITSNIGNNTTILSDFKINGEIDLVIKISYIWTTKNKIGLSSQIYQIKYLAPPEQLNINFIDPIIQKITPMLPPKILSKSLPLNKPIIPPQIKIKSVESINSESNEDKTSLGPINGFVPSVDDLQNAIKKLKSTND